MLSPGSEAMPARRILAEKSGDSSVPETGGEPADHRTGVGDGRLQAVGAPRTCFRTAPGRTCAGNILLAREADFPATIANPCAAGRLPESLRAAHARNDHVLGRIHIGLRFRNDTGGWRRSSSHARSW